MQQTRGLPVEFPATCFGCGVRAPFTRQFAAVPPGIATNMRKSFYAFVIVTGILTVISRPLILFAFLISPPIGYIFAAVPMAFLIGVVFLIGHVTLRKYGVIIWLTVPALLLVTVCVALPMYWNRPLNAEMANLSQGDHRRNEYRFATKKIALLLLPHGLADVKPTDCVDVCHRLLFNGSVSAVLMGSPPFDGNNRVVRYHIERRPTCANAGAAGMPGGPSFLCRCPPATKPPAGGCGTQRAGATSLRGAEAPASSSATYGCRCGRAIG